VASGLRNLRKDLRNTKPKEQKKVDINSKFYADQNLVENNIALKNNSGQEQKTGSSKREIKEDMTSTNDDFDFVADYDDAVESDSETLLPENTAPSSLSVGFIGVGGGGGKMAKAFIDMGFTQTLVVNTTDKDQPTGLEADHFLLIPGADGVGKNVELGRQILSNNSALVEDHLRSKVGRVDWLFVLAGGGGGTGSSCHSLDSALQRYLKSVSASGNVVYVVTAPTAQELLNPTIKKNYEALLSDVSGSSHVVIDNERQLQLLRGKVGMLGLYPTANKNFAKLIAQVLKLSSESSPIQTFDSKDLEACLSTKGRLFLGTTVVKDPSDSNLGSMIYQNCMTKSPCPAPSGKIKTGVLLLVVTEAMASDPAISTYSQASMLERGFQDLLLFQPWVELSKK
jgi:cell division GTPase FtsZ